MTWTTGKIEAAVAPMKADAIAWAEQDARKTVVWVRKELAAAGQDVHICARYPNSNEGDYFGKLYRYKLFSRLTDWRKGYNGADKVCLADVSPIKVTLFVKHAKENAAAQYDLFVEKLVGKIGPVLSAGIEGNHVWGYSFLTVVKFDGSSEVWKTQQIVNYSKLGLAFNQWPSRKVKHKG